MEKLTAFLDLQDKHHQIVHITKINIDSMWSQLKKPTTDFSEIENMIQKYLEIQKNTNSQC